MCSLLNRNPRLSHVTYAALFNPSAAEPLVWLSSLKFISELDLETKALLEAVLMEGNRERELKILKATKQSLTFPAHSDTAFDDDISEDHDAELCSICFYRDCNMEVQDCKHQMCAHCIPAFCCHGKPNPTTLCLPSPICPFCRSNISKLVKTMTTPQRPQSTGGQRGGPKIALREVVASEISLGLWDHLEK